MAIAFAESTLFPLLGFMRSTKGKRVSPGIRWASCLEVPVDQGIPIHATCCSHGMYLERTKLLLQSMPLSQQTSIYNPGKFATSSNGAFKVLFTGVLGGKAEANARGPHPVGVPWSPSFSALLYIWALEGTF